MLAEETGQLGDAWDLGVQEGEGGLASKAGGLAEKG